MNLEELEAKVRELEDKVARLEDIEEIKRLQRIYGYYLDNCMWDEIVDLFSDDADFVEIGDRGIFCGKEGVRRLFKDVIGVGGRKSYGELRDHMQLQGVVTLGPDGKTAKARWRVWGCLAVPIDGVTRSMFVSGPYENEYVKENGKWLFKTMRWYLTFATPYEDGWVKTPVLDIKRPYAESVVAQPDKPTSVHEPYPSAHIIPFHYEHPITGK
jgi:hypothetical protein